MNTDDAYRIGRMINRTLSPIDRVFVTNGIGTEYEVLGYGWSSFSKNQYVLRYEVDNYVLVSSLDWIHSLKVIYG
jgi:hypothetical protein